MVITGYDDKYFYFNDSLRGFKAYPKSLVLQRYKEMGNHALVIERLNLTERRFNLIDFNLMDFILLILIVLTWLILIC